MNMKEMNSYLDRRINIIKHRMNNSFNNGDLTEYMGLKGKLEALVDVWSFMVQNNLGIFYLSDSDYGRLDEILEKYEIIMVDSEEENGVYRIKGVSETFDSSKHTPVFKVERDEDDNEFWFRKLGS